ncbi:MAG: Nif3-like dinuclear metal center hexameric protein [Anaerovoracaceae bacterium]
MKTEELLKKLEIIAPHNLQEEWDNSGFQVDMGNENIFRVLVALEVTNEVIDQAITEDVDLILTHHPLYFTPIKMFDNNTVIGNQTVKLINNNISVFSCHTNFDKVDGGNNDYLAELLELSDIGLLEESKDEFCRVGKLKTAISLWQFIGRCELALDVDKKFFNAVGDLNKMITTVGLCTGSGGEFIEAASNENCDLFVTGDLKYHQAQMAKDLGIAVLDAGHYGTEKIFIDNMTNRLATLCDCETEHLELIKSKIDINPFVAI